MNSVRAGSRPSSVCTRWAPSTLDTKCGRRSAALVGLERLADHQRAEVGAADADVDDVRDGLAAMPPPGAAAHALAEVPHAREHAVDRRHHVRAVDQDRPARAVAQRDVEDRAVLGRVDALAREHPVAPALEVGRAGEVEQQRQRLGGDAVLGEVDQQVVEPQRKALEALGVLGEQLAQMAALDGLGMARERLPRSGGGETRHRRSLTLLGPRAQCRSGTREARDLLPVPGCHRLGGCHPGAADANHI